MRYLRRKATPYRSVSVTLPIDETTAELAKAFFRLAIAAENWGEEEDAFAQAAEDDERELAQENAIVWWGKHCAWRRAGFELSAAAGIPKPEDRKLKAPADGEFG